MYRKKINELIKWKNTIGRKPLVLKGARQVGKTWLMKEFGESQYEQVAYINMENNRLIKKTFEYELDPERIVKEISLQTGVKIDPDNTLIILDEIQAVPRALTSLKYFCEDAPQYDIIVGGSLLGIALHEGTSFPVGKTDFIDLYPLTFGEFLVATGNEQFDEAISDLSADKTLTNTFTPKLNALLKDYYVTGGMPEVVNKYIEDGNLLEVRNVQTQILEAYSDDFSKHAPRSAVPRIREIWRTIPSQLAKENKKFMYQGIKKSARAGQYEEALLWLSDTGLATMVPRVNSYANPLMPYSDAEIFKLFMVDVGLLGAMSGLEPRTILDGDKIFTEFKGGLAEQFVFQELKAAGIKPFYFSRNDSRGEIDFIVQTGGTVAPLEVKASENLQSKSLKEFAKTHNPLISVRTSLSGYRDDGWLINIPLYMISEVDSICQNKMQTLRKRGE
ncbi:MAG: ATP-binding protein [Candidatus Ancillula sp.]|nr:ATP-binding protein [Candidatus Ancillula sp.]